VQPAMSSRSAGPLKPTETIDAGPLAAGPLTAGPLAAGPLAAGPLAAGPLDIGWATSGWYRGLEILPKPRFRQDVLVRNPTPEDPDLDGYARAAALAAGLSIDDAWWPGVVRHLGVLMARAASLEPNDIRDAPLPADSAAVFTP
jgi:hypothetical protein